MLVSADPRVLTIKSLFIRTIFYQVVLAIILISVFFFYLYSNWQRNISSEITNIKQIIDSNFEQYNEIIFMIERKIYDKNNNLKDILTVKRYNQLLGQKDGYVDISDVYIVREQKSELIATSSYGDKLFTILPPQEFFTRLKQTSKIESSIDNNILYIGKALDDRFILLKLDLDEVTKTISMLLHLVGKFTFYTTNENDDISPPSYNLHFKHQKQNFTDVIKAQLDLIYISCIIFLCFSIIWLLNCKRFFKNYSNSFHIKISDNQGMTQKMTDDLNLLKTHKANLESTIDANRSFINQLSIGNKFLMPDFKIKNTNQVSLSKIIYDCKTMLYKDISANKIECEIKISTEKIIDQESSFIFYILLCNFIYRSIYKTPKKGKISVHLYKDKGHTLVRIEDGGFDLRLKESLNDTLFDVFDIFDLSDFELEELALVNNIKIIKLQGAHNNIIDLIIRGKKPEDLSNHTKQKNVIKFPKSR